MGAWGVAAYDNDTAADWFADRAGLVAVADDVMATLRAEDGDGADYHQWRAAAWLVARLGNPYVWPGDHLDECRDLAVERLTEILADEAHINSWHTPDQFRAAVEIDLMLIRAAQGATENGDRQ